MTRQASQNDAKPASREDSKTSGTLCSEVSLTLHTYQAKNLLTGRKAEQGKASIMGLADFSDRLKPLWRGARQDDPYADWFLLKIERGLKKCELQFQTLSQELNHRLKKTTGVDITLAQAKDPRRVTLSLASPYAFQGLRRLAEFDQLVRLDMTLKHLGVSLPQTLQEQVNGCSRQLRQVFALPQCYTSMGINRESVLQGGPSAQAAKKCMQDVPANVLAGERLPTFRPIVRVPLANNAATTKEVESP